VLAFARVCVLVLDVNETNIARLAAPSPPTLHTSSPIKNKLAIVPRLKQSARTHALAPRKFHIHS